jgi:hypothetical protein
MVVLAAAAQADPVVLETLAEQGLLVRATMVAWVCLVVIMLALAGAGLVLWALMLPMEVLAMVALDHLPQSMELQPITLAAAVVEFTLRELRGLAEPAEVAVVELLATMDKTEQQPLAVAVAVLMKPQVMAAQADQVSSSSVTKYRKRNSNERHRT